MEGGDINFSLHDQSNENREEDNQIDSSIGVKKTKARLTKIEIANSKSEKYYK